MTKNVSVLGFQGIFSGSIKSEEDFFKIQKEFTRFTHNNSAALVNGNNIYAIESERIDRVKDSEGILHLDKGYFPTGAIPAIVYCLKAFNLRQADYGFCLGGREFNLTKKFVKNELLDLSKITQNSHHLMHASSAFYPSSFDNAAVMVIDGCGKTANFFVGKKRKINEIQLINESKNRNRWGIGEVWLAHHLLMGLKEEKIMGLSSYGNADKFKEKKLFWLEGDEVVINEELSSYVFTHGTHAYYEGTYPNILKKFYGLKTDAREQDLTKSEYAHVAAKLQNDSEELILALTNKLQGETKQPNLCYAGGVALNGLINKKIVMESKFKKIFIQPAANDGGLGLGCALYGYYHYLENKRNSFLKNTFLGRRYESQYASAINNFSKGIQVKKFPNITEVGAKLISEGNIIGWFQGGSEFGPRALGNRSILADPRKKESRVRINKEIKKRYWWQPFAPSIMKKHVKDYFESVEESPYMLVVYHVKESVRNKIPAVVHVDGTARVQTVEKGTIFFDLLNNFYNITKIPLLLNTSFNLKNEPIVETPTDAINCYLKSKLDYLIIGDYLVSRAG